MNFIEWKSSYNTDIEVIDNQHRHLVDLINELALAKEENRDAEIHAKILKELVDYTIYHFKDEEDLMVKIDFPRYTEHQAQHKGLINQIVQILNSYKEGHTDITDKLLIILNSWLIKHIVKMDKNIGTYYNSKK